MPPTSRKRHRQPGYNRKHDRHKFRRTTNPTVHKKSFPPNLSGILFSCTPHHEDRAFRDAALLLSKHYDQQDPTPTPQPPSNPSADVSAVLQQELAEIRDPEEKLFTRIDGGVQGCVFVTVNRPNVDLERLVEAALREAKTTAFAPSRHCIRMLPIHTTCYAKPTDAATAALQVVHRHFPPIPSGPNEEARVTYAIVFRARLNDGAHREEYIQAIAGAIEHKEPRYKVDLTRPQVVLIVEVVKTSCCLGTFRHFYELAKMNLREAACPTKVKEGGGKGGVDAKKSEGGADGTDGKGEKSTEGEGVAVKESDSGAVKEGGDVAMKEGDDGALKENGDAGKEEVSARKEEEASAGKEEDCADKAADGDVADGGEGGKDKNENDGETAGGSDERAKGDAVDGKKGVDSTLDKSETLSAALQEDGAIVDGTQAEKSAKGESASESQSEDKGMGSAGGDSGNVKTTQDVGHHSSTGADEKERIAEKDESEANRG